MEIRQVFSLLLTLALAGQSLPAAMAGSAQPDVNFKIYSPPTEPVGNEPSDAGDADEPSAVETGSQAQDDTTSLFESETPKTDEPAAAAEAATEPAPRSATGTSADAVKPAEGAADSTKIASKVLQGYIRVVPSGTKIPIIMDTAVDTDTSQEGDEFSARTGEDLTIDGSVTVPAGSIIRGRIAQLNAPRALNRSGSVALKFDTITTPDNRQIPIVANIVARGGVVHARRGMKDIAIDTGIVTLPAAAGLGIGLIAGNAGSSSLGAGGGAIIGAGVGAAVGMAILLSKKGKKVDLRPGDELKIELAEDLRMPM